MFRVSICGFYGWGNLGDEGILLAIMDSLGDNEYLVYTSLPHTMLANYKARLPQRVVDVRQIYDVRCDYDFFLLGGGALSWGYGWRQAINAFSHNKTTMNYGVGFRTEMYSPRMRRLYSSFLEQFSAITLRDQYSLRLLKNIARARIYSFRECMRLTACPSINLKEEKVDAPKNMIAVCPRYEDYGFSNEPQLTWLTNRLAEVEDEVLLIPFGPYSSEGTEVDLALCKKLQKRLKHSTILTTNGFNPRQIKYVISQSKRVISGGRLHAVVWASAHNVPFETSPTCSNYPKVLAYAQMHFEYGSQKLKEMEKNNEKTFSAISARVGYD